MDVNKNILNYLKIERISQSELASKTGISQQNLNRLLNSKNMRVDQLLEISNALELPATYFFGLHERLNQEEIITYNKQIEELEKSNKELLKTVNFLTETLRVEIEESKKLLRAVTILFISEDKEEAEKARQMLVSLVRFYDTDNKLLRGIRGNKNISKKDQKRNSF